MILNILILMVMKYINLIDYFFFIIKMNNVLIKLITDLGWCLCCLDITVNEWICNRVNLFIDRLNEQHIINNNNIYVNIWLIIKIIKQNDDIFDEIMFNIIEKYNKKQMITITMNQIDHVNNLYEINKILHFMIYNNNVN